MNKSVKHWVLVLIVAMSAILWGCGQSGPSGAEQKTVPASPILATVNGEAITEQDVYDTIERTFSDSDKLFMNEEVYSKVLDSLIASKAMVHAMKTQMSEGDIEALQRKVDAYEEELYVKRFLADNATPIPVTTQMVRDYYDDNPEKFGAKTIKEFEQLSPARRWSESERDRFIADHDSIAGEDNWSRVADASTDRYPLVHRRANAAQELLAPEYNSALKGMAVGDAPKLFFVEGAPVLLRVVGEKTIPPKPLHEVSGEIRKILAPLQLRKAVKVVSDTAIAQADVSYKD